MAPGRIGLTVDVLRISLAQRRTAFAATLGLTLALGVPVRAQSPPAVAPPDIRQEVFVTATIAPVSLEALGRAVAVISGAELAALGLATVADALRIIPGIDVRARGPRDVQSDFSLRGATFNQNLILVDGQRLNDSQSGHHNGDLPVPIEAIDRIEVLQGPGSSAHGADALGGTINLLTRRDGHATATASAGQHGLLAARGSVSGGALPRALTAAAWGSRSGGFQFDRDFAMGGGLVRASLGRSWTLDVRHQRKAFGANGFYGPSPSKEWTDQTLIGAGWRRARGPWSADVRGLVRDHGDHFRWDINRPGFAENRHRTDAIEATAAARRELPHGVRLSCGAGGGADQVRSTNLGDRTYRRGFAFVESQWTLGPRIAASAGLRYDAYSTFGRAWSPSLASSVWLSPALRLRASAARAFRVPTFTELYYRDPSNIGSADLAAERGWSADGGLDWFHGGWTVSASPFRRWDRDVIDWVRQSTAVPWRSTNVRDVTTTGLEASVVRRWPNALVRASVSVLDLDAPALAQLSKYVLEYARRSVAVTLAAPVAAGVRASLTIDHRSRLDGQSYELVGLRVSRRFRRAEWFIEATNLFDVEYTEIAGVAMPGRWTVTGVTLR